VPDFTCGFLQPSEAFPHFWEHTVVNGHAPLALRGWFIEVWNESNLVVFWTGEQEDYFRLYRSTVTALKSVDVSLKVGGPATANNQWIPEFLNYCKKNMLSVDFVGTHHYPTGAFGNPGADMLREPTLMSANAPRKGCETKTSHCAKISIVPRCLRKS
jgi:beta-xylosidase